MAMNAFEHGTGAGRAAARAAVVCCALAWAVAAWRTTAAAPGQTPAARAAQALTTAAEVRALPLERAALRLPVRLDAVVTFADPAWRLCFVSDGSGSIFVRVKDGPFTIEAGQRLHVEGHAEPGDFAPVVDAARVQVTGRPGLPPAAPVSVADMLAGRHDSAWVEVAGVVRRAWASPEHLELDLAADGQRLQTTLPLGEDRAALRRLVGARVRLRAACGTIFNRSRQMIGVRLFVPRLAAIDVLEPAPADPFDAPPCPVNRLFGYRSHGEGRARVRGVVTSSDAGGSLYVEDATGGLRVRTLARETMARGTEVEVAGYPARDAFSVVLEDAVLRRTGRVLPVAVGTLDPAAAAEGADTNRLMSVTAELVAVEQRPKGTTLLLRAGQRTFEAPIQSLAQAPAAWQPGARLGLTGIVFTVSDEHRRAQDFRLLVAGADDVALLAPAPLWTIRRLFVAIATLALLTALTATWVFALRRRVRAQTRVIKARLEERAQLERRFSTLFDNANDIVFTLDESWRFTSINRAGERVLGFSRDEMQRYDLAQLILPEHVARARAAHAAKIEGRAETTIYEIDVIGAGGRVLTVEVNSRLHRTPDGQIEIHGIARDVTEKRRAAEELEAAHRSAEAASRAKSEFLAVMSHELRTPLNGVIGMNEMLSLTRLDDDQRGMVRTVQESAEQLVAIIGDVLDFAKMEAGRLRLEERPFDLHERVHGTVALWEARAAQKGLELRLEIADGVPRHVVGDALRLRQVIGNLVGNAVKFTERGTITVRLDRGACGVFGVEVRDTGAGIPGHLLPRLFRPFEQADTSTARTHGGSGLGLAICRQIVTLMGGHIEAANDPAGGAVFRFTVQLAEATDDAAAAESTAPEALELPPGLRVLLVEDNPVNRLVARRQLSRFGLDPDEACDGREALAALESTRYDLVFMDCHMPEFDGYEVTRRLRGMAVEQPWVIAMTAAAMEGDRQSCLAAGMDDYLTKPARVSDLSAALGRFVLARTGVPA